jgi:hypothetical protein
LIRLKFIVLLFLSLLIQACGSSDNRSDEDSVESHGTYKDGTYCADIKYYNPNTGTRNTYQLNVEVESNAVIKIIFPNGGWLDDDHFYPEQIDRNGYCSFTSDQRNKYEISIRGPECIYTDESRLRIDTEEDKDEITCSKCGSSKYEYDLFCSSCQDEIDDKNEKTCHKCGQYDALMLSTDEQCFDCERQEESLKEEYEDERNSEEEDNQ